MDAQLNNCEPQWLRSLDDSYPGLTRCANSHAGLRLEDSRRRRSVGEKPGFASYGAKFAVLYQLPDSKPNPVLDITNCNVIIAISNMKLGEKIRYLRLVEGTLRGMGREMTQQDLVVALKKETGSGLSQSYLSQIESGARPHLTNASRMLLARFFKVHPGYLVDDPEGYHTELTSDLRAMEDRLDLWLINGAEQFARDPELSQALLQVAKYKDSRKCLVLLGAILEAPELVERLTEVLKPSLSEQPPPRSGRRKKLTGANV